MVFRSAADHSDLPNLLPCQVLDILDYASILQRQAVQNRPDVRTRSGGSDLVRPRTELLDRQGHVGRAQECPVIRINQMSEWRFSFRHFHQLLIVELVPPRGPRLPTALQHP